MSTHALPSQGLGPQVVQASGRSAYPSELRLECRDQGAASLVCPISSKGSYKPRYKLRPLHSIAKAINAGGKVSVRDVVLCFCYLAPVWYMSYSHRVCL